MYECRDWVEDSPENPWVEAFDSWASQIREHVGNTIHDTLVCDFTTTGPVESAASHVVMMGVFDRYFHYQSRLHLRHPLRHARRYHGRLASAGREGDPPARLRPRLVAAAPTPGLRAVRPRQPRRHGPGALAGICKLREQYGGDVINGWVAMLFPCIRSFIGGPCNRRNSIFQTGQGFRSLVAPSGLSRVLFTWHNATTGSTRPMEAVGGFLGVAQDRDPLALGPKVGWAVRAAEKLDVLLDRLVAEHATVPGTRADGNSHLPEDLCAFYHRTNGAELYGRGGHAAVRIAAVNEIRSLDWGEDPKALGSCGPDGRIWHRFARLADGRWPTVNLDLNKHSAPWRDDPELVKKQRELGYSVFAPICLCSDATRNRPGANPVVALCFTELLEQLIDCGGKPACLEPGFAGYGDAELFTRRK